MGAQSLERASNLNRIRRELTRFSFSRLLNSIYKHALYLIHGDNFFVTTYYGCRFLVRMGDLVGREIARNRADLEQLPFLLERFQVLKPNVFIDIGANAGLYSCIAVTVGEIPKAIAFEPDHRNAATMRANLMMNDIIDLVTIHQIAISDATGRRILIPGPSTQTGMSRLSSNESDGAGYHVDTARLDDVVTLKGETLAIKIDVETTEFEVLQGMTRTLTDNNAIIQIETDKPDRLSQIMNNLGYRMVAKFNYDFVFEKP